MTIVVDAVRQRRFVFRLTWLPMFFLLGAAVATTLLVFRLQAEVDALEGDAPSLVPAVGAVLLLLASSGAVMVVRALHHSHRVIGPAQRIAAALDRLHAGEQVPPLLLRPDDELHVIADAVNRLAERLQSGPHEWPGQPDGAIGAATSVTPAPDVTPAPEPLLATSACGSHR